jgi:hypothetical protein
MDMKNATLALLLLLAFLLAALPRSYAADIRETNNKLCAFALEGTIVTGDYDRLAALTARTRPDEQRATSLCLKSAGGSYVEALKIPELLYTRGFSTVVADGSERFSACAIIFMAGVASDNPGSPSERPIMPYRKLSAGGILGFHAPFFTLPDARYSKNQAEAVAQAMRVAIRALVQFSSKQTIMAGGDFIKKSLIEAILAWGPQDVLAIRTIGEAARWNIEIYDALERFPEPRPVDGAINLYNNLHSSNMDNPIQPNMNLSINIERYDAKFGENAFRVLVRDARSLNTVCEIYPVTFGNSDKVAFLACSYDYWIKLPSLSAAPCLCLASLLSIRQPY